MIRFYTLAECLIDSPILQLLIQMNSSGIPARTPRRQYKIVLLGQSTVGKTTIIQQFIHNRFEQNQQPTVGIDFYSKVVSIRGTECKLQLWDSAGQQKYMSLVGSYLRDADCALFIFDLNNPVSLQKLQRWIQLYMQANHSMGVAYICGNKSDLQKNINSNILNHLITCYKLPYHILSARTKQNLHELFLLITNSLLTRRPKKLNQLCFNLHSQDVQSQPTEGGMLSSKALKLSSGQNKQDRSGGCVC